MHHARWRALTLCLALSVAPAHASPAADRAAELARCLSTGDADSLRSFVARAYIPLISGRARAVDQVAGYWLSIYREFGPLGPVRVEREEGLKVVAWARGTLARAWLGLEIEVSPQGMVSGAAVVRGVRPSFDSTRVTPRAADWADSLRADLDRLRARDLFSGCVVVADRDQVLFEWCGGRADSTGAVVTADTRFDIASVTKMLTATAVLQLVQQKRVSLDDPLSKFLPEYPESVATRVRIRDLLTHRSGIELDEDSAYVAQSRAATSIRELVTAQVRNLRALPQPASALPLATFDYSNEGFDLLGAVVERVTKREFFAHLRQSVFQPAGMKGTQELDRDSPSPPVARGYTSRRGFSTVRVLGPRVDNALWRDRTGRPSGGCAGTALDLARFAAALRDGRLMRSDVWAQMRTSQVSIAEGAEKAEAYGLGAWIWKERGVVSVGHSGGLPGASARLETIEPAGLTIVALSNYDFVANVAADLARERLGY